eukprot:Pgem_evm1s397
MGMQQHRDEKKFDGEDPATAYSRDAYINKGIKENKEYLVTSNTTLNKVKDCAPNDLIIISGQGPAGLMAALVAKKMHPEKTVLVTEKRMAYSRRNIAIIKTDAYPFLKRMGVLVDVCKVSDRMSKTVIGRSDGTDHLDIRAELPLDNKFQFSEIDSLRDYSPELMQDDTQFTVDGRIIRICDLQELLFKHCLKAGIKTLKKSINTIDHNPDTDTVTCRIRKKGKEIVITNPYTVIIAEGAKSPNVVRLAGGWNYGLRKELWTVSNVEAQPKDSYMGVVRPNNEKHKRTVIGLFSPINKEIAVTECYHVTEENAGKLNAKDYSTMDTNKLGSLFGVKTQRLKWNSSFFECQDKIAKKLVVGSRILVVGDAAGVSSPVSGMGVSMAVTSHNYGVLKFFEEKKEFGVEIAAEQYEQRLTSYVKRWQRNTHNLWHVLDDVLTLNVPEVSKKEAEVKLQDDQCIEMMVEN